MQLVPAGRYWINLDQVVYIDWGLFADGAEYAKHADGTIEPRVEVHGTTGTVVLQGDDLKAFMHHVDELWLSDGTTQRVHLVAHAYVPDDPDDGPHSALPLVVRLVR